MLTALIAAALFGQAQLPDVHPWRLSRRAHGCSIEISFGDNDTLALSYQSGGEPVLLWLVSDRLKAIVEGEQYRVSTVLVLADGTVDGSWSGMTFHGQMLGGRTSIVGGFRPALLDDLSKTTAIEIVKDGSSVAIHPLEGASAAMSALKGCGETPSAKAPATLRKRKIVYR